MPTNFNYFAKKISPLLDLPQLKKCGSFFDLLDDASC
jgi:hypothetical protein